LPAQFEGLKVAVISDIHFPKNISRRFVAQACDLAMSQSPDLVVLPGDFVDGHDRTKRVPDMRGLYDALSAPLGVWGSFGNHDVALGEQAVLREIRSSTPVRMMANERVVFERGQGRLCLAAVGDLWYGVVDLRRALDGVPSDVPRLLLSHNPDLAEDVEPGRHRIDLQISGHTHGGEVLVPGLSFTPSKYGDKFRQGLVKGRAHLVYVTRGIGSPRFARFMSRPEVSLLTLVRAPEHPARRPEPGGRPLA
jgi:predicted MPP superfamily phosphohydrolase